MAVYFVTDFHLGIPTLEDSQKRERKLLRFLTASVLTARNST